MRDCQGLDRVELPRQWRPAIFVEDPQQLYGTLSLGLFAEELLALIAPEERSVVVVQHVSHPFPRFAGRLKDCHATVEDQMVLV